MRAGGYDFDVGIIGGGPGGAAAAGYLALAGVRCVVLEREVFPRPHVGESLVPSSTRVFRELGFLDTMFQSGFPKKYGAAWTWPNRRDGGPDGYADVCFRERPQEGVPEEHTWHVDRGRFDLLLLDHAARLGATVLQGAAVRDVEVDPAHGVDIRYDLDGRHRSLRARMVVDASGRRTLVGSRMGWKVKDPVFDQFAVHTWFRGYDRSVLAPEPAKGDFIYVHFLPGPNTWVWQIPISDDDTSIGVVTQRANFARRRSGHDAFFREQLATRPVFADALARAEQLRPLKTEGDYSYAMTQIADDRVVLIGDAARFVDPIFSTGVSIALNSARFASRDIVAAMEAGDFSRPAFARYETTMRRGTKNWYDFITAYYRLNVLFTAFLNDPRHRLDVLKLLQGDVYDEDAPTVLRRMQEIVGEVERNPRHALHGFLNELTGNAFAPRF